MSRRLPVEIARWVAYALVLQHRSGLGIQLAALATRRALAGQLAEIDGVLPGSVVVRRMRCGKSGCACHDDPPTLHGPYTQWTRAVGGKTVTRYLSEDDLARYQPWFDNARRLKEIAAKLEIASLHALEIEQTTKSNNPLPDSDPTRRVTRRRSTPRCT